MEYVPAKTILHRNKSADWFGADYTVNLYRGCCHGCIYCDSRSDCYGIEDFDRVRAKKDALNILRDELRRKVRPGLVSMGAMSDPYNPFEETELLTRRSLELIDTYGFGVAVATKSDLIVRDIDSYQRIAAHSPVVCKLTVTTADEDLAAKVEPGAPSPERRLAAVKKLADAGLFAGILLMPVLPFLEDSWEQVEGVLEGAAAAGAKFVYPAFGMTTRDGQREHYYRALETAFPGQGLAERCRARYGMRYQCISPNAAELLRRFRERCDELGVLWDMGHIISASQKGYGDRQLSFFE